MNILSPSQIKVALIALHTGLTMLLLGACLFAGPYVQRVFWPPERWFQVRDFYVPDHFEGQNPIISYARDIHKPFRARWVVEVQMRLPEGFYHVCGGDGVSQYDPEDKLPIPGVTLEWFVGKQCHLSPGRYRLAAVWRMEFPVGFDLDYTFTSNEFEVTKFPPCRHEKCRVIPSDQ